jgi:hypothetical protein
MSSSAATSLIFHEPETIACHSARADAARRSANCITLTDFTPKLIAAAGLLLFACALVVAFRIIALDASHQLQQPGIDFAICGAIALLGLSISWVHLGEAPREGAQDSGAADVLPPAFEASAQPASIPAAADTPRAAAVLSARTTSQAHSRCWLRSHSCPFCGQKMIYLGSGRHVCAICRHSEDHGRLSFLDGAHICGCDHCCQTLQHAV